MFNQEWKNEKIDRHLTSARTFQFGISYLDDALVGMFPNELMLLGARSGRGKTQLATTIALNAARAGKNVTFFALEADQWEIQRRIKYRKLAHFYHENYANQSHGMKFPRFREWLAQGFDATWNSLEDIADRDLGVETSTLDIQYKGSNYTPEKFIEELSALQDADLIIVDHLHYFDLTGAQETEGLKKAIHAIRDASIHHGKPIFLLAHLRKQTGASKSVLPSIDDFHGHSDIAKVSTTILITAPAEGDMYRTLGAYPTFFHIAKCRTAGEVTPYVGVVGFDLKKNNYADRYYVCTDSRFEDPVDIADPNRVPEWAKRAIRPNGQFISSKRSDYANKD